MRNQLCFGRIVENIKTDLGERISFSFLIAQDMIVCLRLKSVWFQ